MPCLPLKCWQAVDWLWWFCLNSKAVDGGSTQSTNLNHGQFQAAMRLSALASALEAVGETVQQVVERLPTPGEGYNWVTDRVAEQYAGVVDAVESAGESTSAIQWKGYGN